ncbi:hypothetical protein FRB91_011072 [Serendipita sp. 411]|nr:hypothetical protein FRB91_011072 [Serendipita sp. 411]
MPVRILTPQFVDGIFKGLKIAPTPPSPPAHGLAPPALDSNNQYKRCLLQLRSKGERSLEKYIFLSSLKQWDEEMFYAILIANMPEITPLIYTPTVGEACLEFSHIYRKPEGLYVSIDDKGNIKNVLKNWPKKNDTRITVVTDGSRILGLGDLGVNGMPISIGKLSLYIGGAGFKPQSTLPICLDLGTNNPKNLEDPLYLGLRRNRVDDKEMDEFMDEFMEAMAEVFPKILVQFEDFSTEHAFHYLDRYRNTAKVPVFNDDIQGTGAVVLSGFVNAAKLSSDASGRALTDHKVLFLGAGSAGVGVAKQVMSFFTLQGMSEEEAKSRIYFIDSQGLITVDRPKLQQHKIYFARKDYTGPPLKNLIDIVNYVKPTALFGLSTTKGAFTKQVIERMADLNPRPIIFPLSNPVSLSECEFKEAIDWTDGRVIFASGSPFLAYTYKGKEYYAGQGNNMYVFPGIGFGGVLSKCTHVTSSMVENASLALAESLTQEERLVLSLSVSQTAQIRSE